MISTRMRYWPGARQDGKLKYAHPLLAMRLSAERSSQQRLLAIPPVGWALQDNQRAEGPEYSPTPHFFEDVSNVSCPILNHFSPVWLDDAALSTLAMYASTGP